MPPRDWTDLTANYDDWRIATVSTGTKKPLSHQMTMTARRRGHPPEQFVLFFSDICEMVSSETPLPTEGKLVGLGAVSADPAILAGGCPLDVQGFLFDYGGLKVELYARRLDIL